MANIGFLQTGVPELDAYNAAVNQGQQRGLGQLQMFQGILSTRHAMQQEEQMRLDMEERARTRALLPQLSEAMKSGDRNQILGILSQMGPAQAANAATLAIPKPREAIPIGPHGVLIPQQGGGYQTVGGTSETWSEPYQMGGAWVQRDSNTGQVRQAVSREPTTHITNPPPVSSIVVKDTESPTGWSYKDARTGRVTSTGAPPPASETRRNPMIESIYKDYANNPQVLKANDLENRMKPVVDYMIDFTKTGKSVNANDAALAKMYLAETTSIGSRAYAMDSKELGKLPNLGDRLGNMASSFFAGKDLTDQTRKEMFDYVVNRYKSLDNSRTQLRLQAINRGKANMITADQIFGAQGSE